MIVVLVVLAAIVAFFVIAIAVVGLVVKLLWWAILGVVIGALARLLLPGKQQIGVLATAGAGVAAAFLGGVIGHILGTGSVGQLLIALLAALVIVAVLAGTARARA